MPALTVLEKRVRDIEGDSFDAAGLVFPTRIKKALESSIKSPAGEVNEAIAQLKAGFGSSYCLPPTVSLDTTPKLDGYTLEYLPRNYFIPRIALRDLALHPELCQWGPIVRILDLGSGTGAVTLGLFDVFQAVFPANQIVVYAVDRDTAALERQIELIHALRFDPPRYIVTPIFREISESFLAGWLPRQPKWDLIFSANFLNELPKNHRLSILSLLMEHLAPTGSLVLAEPQDRGKETVKAVREAGLPGVTVYYPCALPLTCTGSGKCWMWRRFEVRSTESAYRIAEGTVRFPTTGLVISWMIINKSNLTVYDSFRSRFPHLGWSVAAPDYYSGGVEVCGLPARVRTSLKLTEQSRGALVGYRTDGDNVFIEKVLILSGKARWAQ